MSIMENCIFVWVSIGKFPMHICALLYDLITIYTCIFNNGTIMLYYRAYVHGGGGDGGIEFVRFTLE